MRHRWSSAAGRLVGGGGWARVAGSNARNRLVAYRQLARELSLKEPELREAMRSIGCSVLVSPGATGFLRDLPAVADRHGEIFSQAPDGLTSLPSELHPFRLVCDSVPVAQLRPVSAPIFWGK